MKLTKEEAISILLDWYVPQCLAATYSTEKAAQHHVNVINVLTTTHPYQVRADANKSRTWHIVPVL
jgi:hypothetical protein